jgi:hypothetical protein
LFWFFRLADLPVASGNFQTNGAMTSFEDRYIVLIGGYQYADTCGAAAAACRSMHVVARRCCC